MAKDEKKIISDEDWKTQAQQEKEKLSDTDKPTDVGQTKAGPLPPADFSTLINSLVVQAMFCLGRLSDGKNEKPQVNLDLAKHNIDLLGVIDEKTKGNLTEDESKMLSMTLHEMRMLYVQEASK